MDLVVTEKSYAFQVGRDAFYRGMMESENPYQKNSQRYSDWLDGYFESKELGIEKDDEN